MMVAMRNLLVEWYGYCTVRQMYENVSNNVVNVTNGLKVSLAIPYIAIRIMEGISWRDGRNVNNTLGWINAGM